MLLPWGKRMQGHHLSWKETLVCRRENKREPVVAKSLLSAML